MRTDNSNGMLTIYLEGRIDSSNALEVEKELLDAAGDAQDVVPVIDAANLAYISSAGLRALMKLRKGYKKPVRIINTSPEVYDIFEVTGFTELFDVKKSLRNVSVEGLELIGEGANGKVYRFTPDEMIKVFREGISMDTVEAERESSKKAFLFGVPCAIPFDTVLCGESYGTIYEMLKAKTLTEVIRANPDTLEHYAKESAVLLKKMHTIEVPEGQMQSAANLLYHTIDSLTEDFTPEEIALMHRLYDAIPKMNRFIHNDYHTKNIMESEGELILIDLGDAGAGNPLIDLIHCYMVYLLIGSGTRENTPEGISFIGLSYGQMNRFWEVFLSTYCGSGEEAERMNQILEPYGWLMYLTTAMSHPLLPKEYHSKYVEMIREKVFPNTKEMEASVKEVRFE